MPQPISTMRSGFSGCPSIPASVSRWRTSSANFWIWRNLCAISARGWPCGLVTPRSRSHGRSAGIRYCLVRSCAAADVAGAAPVAAWSARRSRPCGSHCNCAVCSAVNRWASRNVWPMSPRSFSNASAGGRFCVRSRVAWRHTRLRCGPALSAMGRTNRLRSVASSPRYFPSVSLASVPSWIAAVSSSKKRSRAGVESVMVDHAGDCGAGRNPACAHEKARRGVRRASRVGRVICPAWRGWPRSRP